MALKIIATSVGAQDIIKKSKVFTNLSFASMNVDYLIATTSRFRNKNLRHIKLKPDPAPNSIHDFILSAFYNDVLKR